MASDCVKSMKLSIPFLVDDMKDDANRAYSAWPDRIYVIASDGRIAYRAGQGPWGFKPKEAEDVLDKLIPW